jgi:hypothetical protein
MAGTRETYESWQASTCLDPEVISEAEVARELGPWARGYALDQLLSGDKARRRLGWQPRHLDPEREIACLNPGPSRR